MANPNIISATSTYLNNSLVVLGATTETLVVSNTAASGKVMLVDSLYAANVDGVSSCDFSLLLYPNDTNTGTAAKITSTVAVPADATVIVLSKDAPIALKEGQSIYAVASAANDIHVVCSWKEFA